MGLLFDLSFFAALLVLGMYRSHCANIIGGKESAPHSRPYMAAIMNEKDFECGGTLILKNWVLTAAHCEVKKKATVVLGAHSLSKKEAEKQIFQVTEAIPHPEYNEDTSENDIMLLQLNRKAKITQAVKTLPIPTIYDDVKPGTRCLVIGWGITENRGRLSDTLREATVTVIDRKICNDKQHYNFHPVVTMNMTCASGVKKKRTDTCDGDSGGPLLCGGIQRGITSFGEEEKCGDPQYPGVYARLTKAYVGWINETIRRNLD